MAGPHPDAHSPTPPAPPASVPHRPRIRCFPGQSRLHGPGLSFPDSTVRAVSKGPCSARCAPGPRTPPGIVRNSQELPDLDFVCGLHPCAPCRVSYRSLSLLSCLECTLARADSMRIHGKTLQLADETVSWGGWATWGLDTTAVLGAPFPRSWFSFPSVLSCRRGSRCSRPVAGVSACPRPCHAAHGCSVVLRGCSCLRLVGKYPLLCVQGFCGTILGVRQPEPAGVQPTRSCLNSGP